MGKSGAAHTNLPAWGCFKAAELFTQFLRSEPAVLLLWERAGCGAGKGLEMQMIEAVQMETVELMQGEGRHGSAG